MSQNLWTAFIAANGSNQILVDSTPDGTTWTGSRFINQWSPFTPSLAFLNGSLYCAFITNDVAVSGNTRTPSNRIFVCSTADGVTWSPATFIKQTSKCAPFLVAWGDSLTLAFIANDPSNRVLVCSFTPGPQGSPGTWSGATDTGQTSPQPPSLAVYNNNDLYLAFVSNDSRNAILVSSISPGGSWGGATDTNQSCKFSPSLAAFNDSLYVAFVSDNAEKTVLVCSWKPGQSWSANTSVSQTSSAGPNLAVFNNNADLCVGFIANSSSAECLLTSSSNPSSAASWPHTNTDLRQSSDSGTALAVAPFACCSQMAPAPSEFGGAHNYFLWSGSCPSPTNLTGLTLTIEITSDLLSTNGLSFQWNGWSPVVDNLNCRWQQYGFTIDTGGNLNYFVENWPSHNFTTVGGQQLAGNIVDHRSKTWIKLPTPTLPAGYTLTIELDNEPLSGAIPQSVTNATFTVYNQGVVVGVPFSTALTALHIDTGKPTTVTVPPNALAPFVGFQLALVGIANDETANFVSGAGSFTVTSSNLMTPIAPRPTCITTFPGTGEGGNSTYAQLPACPSFTMVQPFYT